MGATVVLVDRVAAVRTAVARVARGGGRSGRREGW